MTTTVTIHHGPYESIPTTASPGLQFLKRFLPAMDSLTPSEETIRSLFTPNAPILVGSEPPTSACQATPIMQVRGRHVSHFHHHVHIAWDIDLSPRDRPSRLNEAGNDEDTTSFAQEQGETKLYAPLASGIAMKRTVMFEATSATTFTNEPDQFPIKVREFNILDLEGRDPDDLQVVEMRIFLDTKPIQARAASLQMESAFGEAQREVE